MGRLTRRDVLRGGAALGVGTLLAGCTPKTKSTGTRPSAAASSPKRGGQLIAGISGGSAKDTVQAWVEFSQVDIARIKQLYERLVGEDHGFQRQLELADEVTPNATADMWTIRVRDGVEFHNGKTLSSDDVIFSLLGITDPKNPTNGTVELSIVDRANIKKIDSRTVQVPLHKPSAVFPEALALVSNVIVPVGYDPRHPVGTGPFKFKSFTPGQSSVFVRNENYWRTGEPYVDEVEILDFSDDTARVNALLGGQVDCVDSIPLGQISVIQTNGSLKLLSSETGSWVPFCMRVDIPPFDDVRVRQAFRLIVDRPQMVAQALGGQGRIANDLYSPSDPCYATDLPQRAQDIAQARSLLQAAGQSNLQVDLFTSPASQGMVEAAQVFVEQAKAAGVSVNLRQIGVGDYYGSNYLQYAFSMDYYYSRNLISQSLQGDFSTAPYNETHWNVPKYDALIRQAQATTDEAKRCELLHQTQQMMYDSGGYIIWGFRNIVDAFSSKVTGFVPDKSGINLSEFGFREVSFV
jgi:peptide/nickel transport system substrate-binding protein